MNLFDSIQSVQTLAQQIWFVTFPLAPRCQTSDNTRFWDPKATKTQKDKVFLTAHHSKKALQVCSLLVFVFQLLFTCFWFIVMVVFSFWCVLQHGFFFFPTQPTVQKPEEEHTKKHGLTCLEVLFVFVNCCFLAVSSPLVGMCLLCCFARIIFSYGSFPFILFSFFSLCFIEETIANLDHWHVILPLSLADSKNKMNQTLLGWGIVNPASTPY